MGRVVDRHVRVERGEIDGIGEDVAFVTVQNVQISSQPGFRYVLKLLIEVIRVFFVPQDG